MVPQKKQLWSIDPREYWLHLHNHLNILALSDDIGSKNKGYNFLTYLGKKGIPRASVL